MHAHFEPTDFSVRVYGLQSKSPFSSQRQLKASNALFDKNSPIEVDVREMSFRTQALVFCPIFCISLFFIAFSQIPTSSLDLFTERIKFGSGVLALQDLHITSREIGQPLTSRFESAAKEDTSLSWFPVGLRDVLRLLKNECLVGFLCLFLLKYVRLVVNAVAFWNLKPVRPLLDPTFRSSDVTVIIPTTMDHLNMLVDCISSVCANMPERVILVTKQDKLAEAALMCKAFFADRVETIGVPRLGKRLQLVAGLRRVTTPLTVFADDDVIWDKEHLTCLLAALEDPQVGAVASGMRCIRNPVPNIWNFLGISYLERRNFNTGSTNSIDGGISTLSGRTAMYRTEILQNEHCYEHFQNEHWLGRILNTDDDKCLTKWVYSHGWKIHLQFAEEATLHTTLETSATLFVAQCVRWARAHWRGNIRVMINEDYWYKTHPWTCYATYVGSFLTPSIVVDGLLLYLLHKALDALNVSCESYHAAMTLLVVWMGLTKMVKLLPHLYRYPKDIRFIPASILFAYLHGFINIYALLTLHKTDWGSRAIVDELS